MVTNCSNKKATVKKATTTYTPLKKFTYENSMYIDDDYDWSSVDNDKAMPEPMPYDDTIQCIRSITIAISRTWEVTHKIKFPTLVTRKVAVEAAEAFLSKPFTRALFAKIRIGNWMCDDMTFKSVVAERLCIGDLLGDATYLEGFTIDAKGNTQLIIGS